MLGYLLLLSFSWHIPPVLFIFEQARDIENYLCFFINLSIKNIHIQYQNIYADIIGKACGRDSSKAGRIGNSELSFMAVFTSLSACAIVHLLSMFKKHKV